MQELMQSYVHGASDVPLLGTTIGQQFDKTVEQYGERDALVVCHQHVRWTYSQLKEKVDAVALGLISLGLERGDRVGIWSPNNAEWVVTQFACAQIGLILVNINPAYRTSELKYALNKVTCKALITAEKFKSSCYLKILLELAPEFEDCLPGKLKSKNLPYLKIVIRLGEEKSKGMYNFSELEKLGSESEKQQMDLLKQNLQFDDAINIQFTSGTTGFPKGATLTHHNILNNGYFNGQALRLSEKDKVCIPVPLYLSLIHI